MEANKPEATVSGILRLLLLVFRHVAAPFISFAVSYITVLVGCLSVSIFGMAGQVGFFLVCGLVGFCGVYSGARYLPPATRRPGSVGLLLLGLFYFYRFVAEWGDQISDEGKVYNISNLWTARLVFLALGGLIAVLVICVPPRKMPWKLSEKIQPQ